MSMFKKAEKSQTNLRMAITGPAGSGKTLGALLVAKGLIGSNGKIALIDTENASAAYYADRFQFDTLQMSPPYLVQKYVEAIKAAEEAGYDVIIVDSLSHAWAGEGGILQRKELLDQRPGSNSFVNWGKMTPEHNALVSAVLHSKKNIICTMRSKTDYVMGTNDKGKATPHKVGLAPIQRDGVEYEFDIVLDAELESHNVNASKDRTGVFSGKTFKISEKTGAEIKSWQESGVAENSQSKNGTPAKMEMGLAAFDEAAIRELGITPDSAALYKRNIGKSHRGKPIKEIPREELIRDVEYHDGLAVRGVKIGNDLRDYVLNVKAFLMKDDPLNNIPL